jgi:histidinol-phosphate/aromatic aminotransferase/cobyric acid decarboxylase-like protein/choline kinase
MPHAAKTAPARKAIILAAGMGRRLGPWSETHPKALLPVGGVPLLANALTQLRGNGVAEFVIVVGHQQEQIRAYIGDNFPDLDMRYVVSDRYATTNNSYSLWLAREELDQDILLLEADVLFPGALLARLQTGTGVNAAALARHRPGMDGTVVRLDAAGDLAELIEGKEQRAAFDYSDVYKTINIYRFSGDYLCDEFVPALDASIRAGNVDDYYELILKSTLRAGRWKLRGVDCSDLDWYEIDDHLDLAKAEYMAMPASERWDFLNAQHGGFWRYGVADHAFLYNPYFPPPDMLRRMGADFANIVKHYPVGQRTLAALAADALGLAADKLIIANGASELIKLICDGGRRIFVAAPSFNEYMNATPPANLRCFELGAPDFVLDIEAFAHAAIAAKADIAVVVSPNNPTSLVTPRAELLRLCDRLAAAGILLLVDESFVDFCDEPAAVSLADEVDRRSNLAIIKSLSKVYGACGLRLGYLYTGHHALAESIRARLPIWNINGLAEQFLRLLPRYLREFRESCRQVRQDRAALFDALRTIAGLHAYAPQGNFVFVRLPPGHGGEDLARRLFVDHNIMVKDCGGKIAAEAGQFLRIASLGAAADRRLIDALATLLR